MTFLNKLKRRNNPVTITLSSIHNDLDNLLGNIEKYKEQTSKQIVDIEDQIEQLTSNKFNLESNIDTVNRIVDSLKKG